MRRSRRARAQAARAGLRVRRQPAIACCNSLLAAQAARRPRGCLRAGRRAATETATHMRMPRAVPAPCRAIRPARAALARHCALQHLSLRHTWHWQYLDGWRVCTERHGLGLDRWAVQNGVWWARMDKCTRFSALSSWQGVGYRLAVQEWVVGKGGEGGSLLSTEIMAWGWIGGLYRTGCGGQGWIGGTLPSCEVEHPGSARPSSVGVSQAGMPGLAARLHCADQSVAAAATGVTPPQQQLQRCGRRAGTGA